MATENSPIHDSQHDNDDNNLSTEFETIPTVWKYFSKSMDKNSAVCSICKKRIKTQGGTTTGLHVHLKSKHKIVTPKDKTKGISTNFGPCDSVSYCVASKVVFVVFVKWSKRQNHR